MCCSFAVFLLVLNIKRTYPLGQEMVRIRLVVRFWQRSGIQIALLILIGILHHINPYIFQ